MKKIILALMVIPVSVFANLTGSWIGFGSWTYEGSAVRCNPMDMTWVESDFQLQMVSGQFECEVLALYLDTMTWTKQNGRLIDHNNVAVGYYDDKKIHIEMLSPNAAAQIHIDINKLRPTAYEYKEVWFNEVQKLYIIEGKFFKG